MFSGPSRLSIRNCISINLAVLGNRLQNGLPYAFGLLSVRLSVTLVYYGQTVGWIRMPLGTEVGLRPGDTVLDGDPASPKKGHSSPPIFGPSLLWPNGWMDQESRCHLVQT